MEANRAVHKGHHNVDRRVRELYRYYKPTGALGVIPSWLSAGEAVPSSSLAGMPRVTTPPVADGSDCSDGSSTIGSSRPPTTIGPEALVLGNYNNTLTSFAQLAALRLNMERAFICVLDRHKQYVLAEATRSLNMNDASLHDNTDGIWTGSTGSQEFWSVCQVSSGAPMEPIFATQSNV